MLRLASDADVHGEIIRGLRRRLPEIDLVRAQDALPEGTSDSAVLAWAAALPVTASSLEDLGHQLERQGKRIPGVYASSLLQHEAKTPPNEMRYNLRPQPRLRLRAIDAITTADAGLVGALDVAHIAFALPQQRVILTHAPDFLRLHTAGVEHAGIAYCHPRSRSIGEIIRYLCLMHDCLTPEEMHGQVEYL